MNENILGDEMLGKAPFLITTRDRHYLFYRSGEGLYLQEKENQDWEKPQALRPRIDIFTAGQDAAFTPHLIVLNKGDLYHLSGLKNGENRLSEKLIFQEGERDCNNLLLSGDSKGGLHLLYLAADPGADRWWLFHHYFDGKRWLEPRVIDFGGGAAGTPGCLAAEQSGDLHLVYRVGEGENARLYYRRFLLASLSWDRAVAVSAYGQPSLPGLVIDREENLHLSWCSRQDENYYIYYRKLSTGGWPSGGWGEIETISPALDAPSLPLINYREGKINAGWFSDNKLWQLELTAEGWREKIGRQEIYDCLVLRSCYPPGWELPPATTWILGQGTLNTIELVTATAPPRPGWAPYFQQLDTYSRNLIQEATGLTAAKGELEQALKAKQKEMLWISQHSKQKINTLTGSLQQKNQELQDLERKLQQSIENLKEKTEQAQLQRAEEKKRYQLRIGQLEKEGKQMQQMLLEKENTIARAEKQILELKEDTARLKEENQILHRKIGQPLGWIGRWLGKISQPKS